MDIELSIRERTQDQSDITGEVLYKKGDGLKTRLRRYTSTFATAYAAENDGKYIPPSGDNRLGSCREDCRSELQRAAAYID